MLRNRAVGLSFHGQFSTVGQLFRASSMHVVFDAMALRTDIKILTSCFEIRRKRSQNNSGMIWIRTKIQNILNKHSWTSTMYAWATSQNYMEIKHNKHTQKWKKTFEVNIVPDKTRNGLSGEKTGNEVENNVPYMKELLAYGVSAVKVERGAIACVSKWRSCEALWRKETHYFRRFVSSEAIITTRALSHINTLSCSQGNHDIQACLPGDISGLRDKTIWPELSRTLRKLLDIRRLSSI